MQIYRKVVSEVIPHAPLPKGGGARPSLWCLVDPDQPDDVYHQWYEGVGEGDATVVSHDGVGEVVVVAGVEQPCGEKVAPERDGKDAHEGEDCCGLTATVHRNLKTNAHNCI